MRSNIPDSAIPQIVQMLEAGKSEREISAEMGVNKNTVHAFVVKYDLCRDISYRAKRMLKLRRRKR